jgi:hypothetical protein
LAVIPEKHAGGRPRTLDRDNIMQRVCARLANGEYVEDAAPLEGCTAETIRAWAQTPELSLMYARARESQVHAIAVSGVRIADAATPETAQVARLQVDVRKWIASKLMPRLYGERIEVAGDPDAPLTLTVRFVKGG